jgi:hypothetical protein
MNNLYKELNKILMEQEINNFEIKTYIGVGPIKFGMDRNKVKEIFNNEKIQSFKRTPESEESDFIQVHQMFIYYSKNKCVAVEFGKNSHSKISIIYNRINLLNLKPKQLLSLLKKYDPEIEVSENVTSITSNKLGIAAHCRFGFDQNNRDCDSIMIFSKNYYK